MDEERGTAGSVGIEHCLLVPSYRFLYTYMRASMQFIPPGAALLALLACRATVPRQRRLPRRQAFRSVVGNQGLPGDIAHTRGCWWDGARPGLFRHLSCMRIFVMISIFMTFLPFWAESWLHLGSA